MPQAKSMRRVYENCISKSEIRFKKTSQHGRFFEDYSLSTISQSVTSKPAEDFGFKADTNRVPIRIRIFMAIFGSRNVLIHLSFRKRGNLSHSSSSIAALCIPLTNHFCSNKSSINASNVSFSFFVRVDIPASNDSFCLFLQAAISASLAGFGRSIIFILVNTCKKYYYPIFSLSIESNLTKKFPQEQSHQQQELFLIYEIRMFRRVYFRIFWQVRFSPLYLSREL